MLTLRRESINSHYIVMKNHLIQSLLCVALLGLYGCRADVDIANIDDPTVKLSFGAALPVGEMSAQLGDFLGNVDFGEMVYVREDGVLCVQSSINQEMSLDEINLAEYFEPASAKLVVGDLLPEWLPIGYGPLIGNGQPMVMTCPIGVSLGEINQAGSAERIDSAIINLAQFQAVISIENMDGMTFDKIESIELILPDEMHRSGGNIINVDMEGKGYGQQITVNIDNFVLDLVKDHNQPLSVENAIDSITLMIRFTLSLENGETIMIQRSSAFEFAFSASTLDYAAVFGYFDTSDIETGDVMSINFGDMLPESLVNIKLPFADPKINLAVTTGIGAPLAIHIDNLSATDRNTGEKAYAEWDGIRTKDLLFTNLVQPNDPLDAEKTNEFHFSKAPSEGHIDNLFTVEPATLDFAYNVFMNPAIDYPQMRLTKQTNVKIDAEMSMPFEFNKGLNLTVQDTLKDVNINKMSLDSLLSGQDVVDSIEIDSLSLVLTVKNMMPFNIKLTLIPLDANDVQVMVMQPLTIPASAEWDASAGKLVPSEEKLVVSVTEDKIGKLSEIKKFIYSLKLCDTKLGADLNDVPLEAYPIALSKQGGLSFKIAVVADLDAYLKLEFGSNGKEK